MAFFDIAIFIAALALLQLILHTMSYKILKNRTIRMHAWDLNICCGKTDGGGINADVVKHADVPNYVQVSDIYNLPFRDKQFKRVLCSHTIEHVDDPEQFFAELSRVGEEVTLILAPLWDVGSVINIFEHKWIFLTFRKNHAVLPRYIQLPGSTAVQGSMGQQIRA